MGDLGGPVVHLGVDVDGVVAAPRRADQVVPEALEVGGLAAGAGAGDEQVAAVVEKERGKARVGGALGEAHEAGGRGEGGGSGRRAEVEGDAPVECLVVGAVAGEQILVGAGGGRRRGRCGRRAAASRPSREGDLS